MKPERGSWFSRLAFPLFIALLLVVLFVFRGSLVSIFRDREQLRAWIEARGAAGKFAFVALQVLQVVIFVIPGEIVQVGGGYLYGLWPGALLSLAGIVLGSVFNFHAGRLLGRPFVETVFKRKRIEDIERVTASGRSAAAFFLLFTVPGIPKDALCYVAGMSRLSFAGFLLISTLGRLPGILGSSFIGSEAQKGSYTIALSVLALASALTFVALFFKGKVEAALVRVLHGARSADSRARLGGKGSGS